MQNMNIEQWYQETVGNDSQNTVADNAGIVPSSLYRQLPDKLSPQNVVKIVRAYGGSAIDGLVAVGLIDDDDLRKSESSDALRDATDEELIHELAIRLAAGAAKRNPRWNEPIVISDEDMNEARLRNESSEKDSDSDLRPISEVDDIPTLSKDNFKQSNKKTKHYSSIGEELAEKFAANPETFEAAANHDRNKELEREGGEGR